jgi:uncharacterized membrane protein YkoI
MKAMFLRSLVLSGVLLASALPAGAKCLSDREARRVVQEGGLIPLSAIMDIAQQSGGELVSARLCEGSGGLVYRVVVLGADGEVKRLRVNAQTGEQQ